MTFGHRLTQAIASRGRFCAGIDPLPGLLDDWGLTDSVNGLEKFAMTAVEAMAGSVAVLKPQSAFFERHGSRGVAVLERVLAEIRAAGALAILDVKRGDIGSTAEGYADAYLDPASPLAADAITVSPYLGFASVQPFVEAARTHDKGLFVLALTSNPGAGQVQHARAGERTVAGTVLAELAALNADTEPLGSYGAVVGATIGETAEDLAIHGPLLAPGVGAQGGTPEAVARIFGDQVRNVVPSSSREILSAGPDVAALRDAAARTNDAFRTLVG